MKLCNVCGGSSSKFHYVSVLLVFVSYVAFFSSNEPLCRRALSTGHRPLYSMPTWYQTYQLWLSCCYSWCYRSRDLCTSFHRGTQTSCCCRPTVYQLLETVVLEVAKGPQTLQVSCRATATSPICRWHFVYWEVWSVNGISIMLKKTRLRCLRLGLCTRMYKIKCWSIC